MIRILLLGLLVVAACAPLPRPERNTATTRPAIGTEIVVQFNAGRQVPRLLVERVAARCWLDGIVRGAQMLVDRQSGRVIIVGDTVDLLAADFLAPRGGQSRVRLSGPVIDDPAKRARLVASLDRAARTGETGCPIARG